MDPEPQRVLVEWHRRRRPRRAAARSRRSARGTRRGPDRAASPCSSPSVGRALVAVGSEQARRDRDSRRRPAPCRSRRRAGARCRRGRPPRRGRRRARPASRSEARPAVAGDRAEVARCRCRAARLPSGPSTRTPNGAEAQLGAQLERGLLDQQQPQRRRRVRDPRRRVLAEAQRDGHRVAGQLDAAVQARSQAGRDAGGVADELQPQRLGELERVVVAGESCDRPQKRGRPGSGSGTATWRPSWASRPIAESTSWSVGPPSQTLVCSRSTALTTTLAASGSAHCSIRAAAPPGPTASPGSGSSAIASVPAVPAPSGARVTASALPASPRLERRSQPEPEHLLGGVRQRDLHGERRVRLAAREPGGHARDVHRAGSEVEHRDLEREAVSPREGHAGRGARDRRRPAGRVGRRRDGAGKARGLPGRGQRLREPGRREPLERSRLPQRAQLRDVAGERRVAGPAVEVERLGDRQRRRRPPGGEGWAARPRARRAPSAGASPRRPRPAGRSPPKCGSRSIRASRVPPTLGVALSATSPPSRPNSTSRRPEIGGSGTSATIRPPGAR